MIHGADMMWVALPLVRPIRCGWPLRYGCPANKMRVMRPHRSAPFPPLRPYVLSGFSAEPHDHSTALPSLSRREDEATPVHSGYPGQSQAP